MELSQCYVAAWIGRGQCRMDTCICMAEYLCYSPETITKLLTGYTPIQNKKFKSKKRKQIICEEAAKERNMGRDHEVITLHPQEVYFFFEEITGWS